ncbi:hypothetical protein [Clostridium sp.]|uniref:hypothetical protein n=1 Tax=Clostridium sp. TaxID=1506 RepID=UPI003F3B730B
MKFASLSSVTPTVLFVESEEMFKNEYTHYESMRNGRVHEVFKIAIKDMDFLKILIFNKDYMNIKPIDTFLSYYSNKLPKLTENKYNFITALFDNYFNVLSNKSNDVKELGYKLISTKEISS